MIDTWKVLVKDISKSHGKSALIFKTVNLYLCKSLKHIVTKHNLNICDRYTIDF